MQEAKPIGLFIKNLGQYVHIKCQDCGRENGVWAYTEYVAADCECGLWKGKGKVRTQAHFTVREN